MVGKCEKCQGAGVYPAKNGQLEMYEVNAWHQAHTTKHASESEPCDGWHFIPCGLCGGTGEQMNRI